MKLINEIAKMCDWHKTVNENYVNQCEDRIEKLQKCLPHGSGIDSGCKIDVEKSGYDKVVITFGFHFLDDAGYYDGWEDYRLVAVPRLDSQGFKISIYGKNRRYIKDYLYNTFYHVLGLNMDDKETN
jgi:hypothetical protein